LVAPLHLQVFQLDVKSIFFNRELQKEVYIDQPPRYKLKGKKIKFIDFIKLFMD
jgi:hypothetical protein